jgi:hypothetical protein
MSLVVVELKQSILAPASKLVETSEEGLPMSRRFYWMIFAMSMWRRPEDSNIDAKSTQFS